MFKSCLDRFLLLYWLFLFCFMLYCFKACLLQQRQEWNGKKNPKIAIFIDKTANILKNYLWIVCLGSCLTWIELGFLPNHENSTDLRLWKNGVDWKRGTHDTIVKRVTTSIFSNCGCLHTLHKLAMSCKISNVINCHRSSESGLKGQKNLEKPRNPTEFCSIVVIIYFAISYFLVSFMQSEMSVGRNRLY